MKKMFGRGPKKWSLIRRDTLEERKEPKSPVSPVSPSLSRTDGSTTQRSSVVVGQARDNVTGQDKIPSGKQQSRERAASPPAIPTSASSIKKHPSAGPAVPQNAFEGTPSPPRPVHQESKPETNEAPPKAPSIHENLKPGLWEQAYDAFRDSDPALAIQYEHIVSSYRTLAPAKTTIENEGTAPPFDAATVNEFAPAGPVAWRVKMDQILQEWLKGEGTAVVGNLQESPRNTSDIVRSFRDIIRPVVSKTMHTNAVAWVASSFAAQVRPFTTDDTCVTRSLTDKQALFSSQAAVLSGTAGSNFVFIMSRMSWYCSLPRLLPSDLKTSGVLEGQTPEATVKGRSQGPQGALIDIYKTVLSYLIRMACSIHGSDSVSELRIHDAFHQEIGERERAFATELEPGGLAVEKQLRRLVASAARGQPTYARDGAAAGGRQEAELVDDAESTSSRLLAGLFDQPLDSPDFRFIPDGSRHGLGTAYQWLVSTPQYAAFRDTGDAKRCLWVTGAPGAGKSMLLKAVARHMMRPADQPQEGRDGQHKMASFFCNGGMARPENAALVVRNLGAQVLKEQPALINQQTKWLLNSTGGSESARPTNFYDVSAAFCAMLKDEQFAATCFIVDAIDECSMNGDEAEAVRGMNDLLSLISTTIALSDKVRWLVSLDTAIAEARLDSMVEANRPLHLNLDSCSDALHPAVLKHVGFKVEGLLRTTSDAQGDRYDQEFHDSVQQKLINKSRDNFLWIDLACEIIRSRGSPWNALHILGELPVRVEALYIYAKKAIDRLPMDDSIYCNKVLEAMAITYRPLRISELIDIADLPPKVDPSIVIAKCSVFLQIHGEDVSVAHHSAKEFLRNEIESPLKAHADITRLCLAHLSKALSTADVTITGSKKCTGQEEPAHYATFYWLQHLSAVLDVKANRKTIDAVAGFIGRYFLQWVETLAPFPGLPQVLIQMSAVEDKLRTLASHSDKYADCLRLIQDACRLLRFHLSTRSPLQVKLQNSLLFCPRLGATRGKMLKSEYPWLASTPALQPGSGSLTLEGHTDWVRSCAYSDDGRFLASSSDDATVRIWHPETGELQRELTGFGNWVHRVLFSRGGLLATMERPTVKVWDTVTYVLLRTFPVASLGEDVAGSDDLFQDIAFSVDGGRLATAVESNVVIWDTSSYEVTKRLKYTATILRLRFSGNNQLATAVGDRVIVWGLEDDSVLWESKPHGSVCYGLCFSPDPRWLATGSDDGTVRIWEVTSCHGELPFRTFSGHQQNVVSVSFSPDGRRLASGSFDGTIRLWEVFEGGERQPGKVLLGHRRDLSAVCFSPNGRRLASSSDDATVRVWDVDIEWDNSTDQSGATEEKLTLRHTQAISFVTISTDGRLIASGSEDGLICLWNGRTGDYRASLQEHSGEILWLAFSGNGRRLSSTSRTGNRVVIWDTENANLLYSLDDHYDWVRCAAFSADQDGRLLASASDDTLVRVWDLSLPGEASEQRVCRPKMLRGHTDYVTCASFSADGQYLASGGDDQTVRVWDLSLQTPDPESDPRTDNDNQSTSATSEEDTPHRRLYRKEPGRITGVTFSPDNQQVICSSDDGAITIWDLTLQKQEQQPIKQHFSLTTSFTSLHYSPSHPDWVLTETGPRRLVDGTYSPPPAGWTRWSLSTEQDWILYDEEEMIFLPKRYRPAVRTAASVLGGTVVIGCRSGHVMVFRFEEDGLSPV